MKKYYDSFRKTTDNIKNILEKVDQKDAVNITEIRIRSNKAIAVTIRGETKYVCADGSLTDDPKKGVRIAENEVRENVYLLCDKSEYIYYESIQNGYITDIYGNRTGISADISYRENDKAVITRYNGLNIRIGREFKGCADQIFKYIDCLSFIIVSPPGGGKTTLLKDILNHLNKKI